MPNCVRKQMAAFCLAGLCALMLLTAACHRARVVSIAPPTAPTAPPPEPPGPPSCSLTAEPASVDLGKSVTLSWTSKNAVALDLQPGVGKQLVEGSVSVTPNESTTYTATVTGPTGTSNCIARVTVSASAAPGANVKESNLAEGAAGAAGAGGPMQDAFFDFNKSDLRDDARTALTSDATYLKAHSDAKIRIEGYCDPRGSEEYNLGLGDRRAMAASKFLQALGVADDRISRVSYGKDRLFCTDWNEDCWQKNRRAHVVLVNAAPAGS